jgi:hypothetical protein
MRKNQFFENYSWFSLFFPFRYGSACDHRLFRQLVMHGGHHWLPEQIPVPVLSELWAVRAALSRSKPLVCDRQILVSLRRRPENPGLFNIN